jgi:hypothetical protein
MNVLESEDNLEKYTRKIFTDDGYIALEGYLQTLITFYLSKYPGEYPFNFPIILGIPFFSSAHTVENDKELLGRIKILGQLLGIKEVQFSNGKQNIKFRMDGSFDATDI